MDKIAKSQVQKKPAIRGKRPARKTPSIRKEELVTIAFDLFSERHVASVTIKDIARETGVNTALIYYYFENKEDLFGAVIELIVHLKTSANFMNSTSILWMTSMPGSTIISRSLNRSANWFRSALIIPVHKKASPPSSDQSGSFMMRKSAFFPTAFEKASPRKLSNL